MLPTLALVAVLACRPYSPPPTSPVPTVASCEGADLVRRNNDRIEVSRVPNACVTTRCEGTDRVRRTRGGTELTREVNACTVARCEGEDRVVRASSGWEVSRVRMACEAPPQHTNDVLRFGLTYR